jgi:hypothetical protein
VVETENGGKRLGVRAADGQLRIGVPSVPGIAGWEACPCRYPHFKPLA